MVYVIIMACVLLLESAAMGYMYKEYCSALGVVRLLNVANTALAEKLTELRKDMDCEKEQGDL